MLHAIVSTFELIEPKFSACWAFQWTELDEGEVCQKRVVFAVEKRCLDIANAYVE